MQKIVNQISLFLIRNKSVLVLLGIMTGLLHGDKLFSTNSGIDTEKIIFAETGLYESWLGIGRQGLVLLKWLLGQLDFNPYFAGVLILVFLFLTVVSFGFLFEAVSGRQSRVALLLFGAVLIAHPIITEQLYFTLQGAEVTLAFNMTAGSLYCGHRFASATLKKWMWLGLAIILLIPAFGVYQAFVPLFLFGIIALGCLRFLNLKKADIQQMKKEFIYLIKMCIVFLTAFIINQGITRMFFSASDYLNKQIQWNFLQPMLSITKILAHVRDVMLGKGIFYFSAYLWLALVLVVITFLIGRRKIKKKMWTPGVFAWGAFLFAGLFASPFFLTILMGERPVIRGQLVLPFTTAFMAYVSYVMLADDRIWKTKSDRFETKGVRKIALVTVVTISSLAIWQEADITCRLYYTDAVRYQEDLRLAAHLQQDIAEFTGDCDYRGVVAFVGQRKPKGNCAIVRGDVMGQSLLAWDTDVEPKNFWSSSRIVGFMHCQGSGYIAPDVEQAAFATECAKGMKCYPTDGSITWCKDSAGNGMVVVKLSGN